MKYKKSALFVLFLSLAIFLGVNLGKNIPLLTNEKNKPYNTRIDNSELDKKQGSDLFIEEEEVISTVNLLSSGDLMFHSPQFRSAYDRSTGVYDFSPVFKHVKKHIEEADISIANLETVIAGSHIEYSGFPRFNTPKEAVLGISQAGFDILVTANNHSLDQGREGLINTIRAIDEYGMKNIGTYEQEGRPILIEERDGIRMAFLSYTYGLNGMSSSLSAEELSYMVDRIDEERIKKDIERAEDLDVDLTIVYMHWGYEYHREPSDYQVELGEKMAAWGADIILGSHPHVIQRSEILKVEGEDKFIVYSMGNFLSNQRKSSMGNSYTEDGIMINFKIEKSSLTGKTRIAKIDYMPSWVHRYREDGKLLYEILPIEDALNNRLDIELDDSLKTRLKKSLVDTRSKMEKWPIVNGE